MSVMEPKTYGVKVRDLWVAVDFEAGAVAITRTNLTGVHATEDLGDGVLIDRDPQGRIIAVEVLGDQTKGVDQVTPQGLAAIRALATSEQAES